MTEKEFKLFCIENNLQNKYIITKNKFLNIPNIIGCNKTKDNYIIYYVNDSGCIYKICTLEEEHYTFLFLYLFIKNNLQLELEFDNSKIKELKK